MVRKLLSLIIALLFSFSVAAFAQDKPVTDSGATNIEKKAEAPKKQKTSKKSSRKSKKSSKKKKSRKTQKPKQEDQQ